MKALIVDDESRVRKAIRLLVHWDDHGITEIHEAGNGLEAMEMIKDIRPNIVLMDMLMPLKSGVELMEWIHKNAVDTKFIVISGHDDFEFVRNTLWYSGTDYILKPIDEDVINSAVAKAVSAWRTEEQERLTARAQNVQVNEYRPIYSEKLLTSLIDDPNAHAQAVRRLQDEHILPEHTEKVRLAVLQVDTSDKALYVRFGSHMDLLMFALLNICSEYLQKNKLGVAFRHLGTRNHIVILLWEQLETISTLLGQINEGLYRTLERYMHFGISSSGSFPGKMPALYAEGLNSLGSRDLTVLNTFIHEFGTPDNPPDPKGSLLFSNSEERWKLAILSGQEKLMGDAAEKWISDIWKSSVITPELLERWDRDIERFLIRLLHEAAGPSSDELLKKYHTSIAALEHPNPNKYVLSLVEWQVYWQEMMNQLSQILLSLKLSGEDLIHDITVFIDHNYQNDLSLYDIASRFHVSREYVSRKFKQKHGINIPEYMNRIRISNAKILLQNPGMKIARIAEMVGFKNEKYFSLVFKKQEGISPKEFRKLHEPQS